MSLCLRARVCILEHVRVRVSMRMSVQVRVCARARVRIRACTRACTHARMPQGACAHARVRGHMSARRACACSTACMCACTQMRARASACARECGHACAGACAKEHLRVHARARARELFPHDELSGCDGNRVLTEGGVQLAWIGDASMLHRNLRFNYHHGIPFEDLCGKPRSCFGVIRFWINFARVASRSIVSGELRAEEDVTPPWPTSGCNSRKPSSFKDRRNAAESRSMEQLWRLLVADEMPMHQARSCVDHRIPLYGSQPRAQMRSTWKTCNHGSRRRAGWCCAKLAVRSLAEFVKTD